MGAGPPRGAGGGVRMLPCVLLPLRAQAHWHLQLGRVGRQVLGEKRLARGSRGVCVCGGANLISLQVWVLVRLLFTSPLNHTGWGLPATQPTLSSMYGDPQATLSPA